MRVSFNSTRTVAAVRQPVAIPLRESAVRSRILLCLLVSAVTPAFAQTTVRREAGPAKQEEKAIVLSPFVVTTEGDVGYLAQSSLSGSRLNTNLGDLAAPTTAFTQEFLQDVAVTNVDELSQYMANTKTDYPEGDNLFIADDSARFRIRGLPAFNYSVNFFETSLRLDTYNTERIEQSRGPNSILFGLGSPGGVVNVTTKRATATRNFGSITQQIRSNDGWRTVIDANYTLVPDKAALRLAAVRDYDDGWRAREYDHQRRIYLTGGWQIGQDTRLDAEWERGLVNKSTLQPMVASDAYTLWDKAGRHLSNTANAAWGIKRISTAQWTSIDTATGEVWNWRNKTTSQNITTGGAATWLTDFSVLPKDAVVNAGVMFPQMTDYDRASVFLTHAFTPDFNIELAANAQQSDHEAVTGRGGAVLQVDTNTTLPNGDPNPNAGRTFVEHFPGTVDAYDKARNVRLSAAYTRDLGRWGTHQFAALYEHDWTWRRAGQRRPAIVDNPYNTTNPNNGNNSIRFRTYFDLDDPVEAIGAGDWRTFFGGENWRDQRLDNVVDSTTGRVMGVKWINNAVPQDNRFQRDSAMAILQSRFFDNRLVTVAGYRADWQDSWYSITDAALARGPGYGDFTQGELEAIPGDGAVTSKARNLTYSALYRVTKNIAITYNHSRNSALPDPNAFIVGSDSTGRPPNPLGRSEDIGVKFNLGSRLSVNVLYYKTSAEKDTANYSAQIEGRYPIIWAALDAAGVPAPEGGSANDVPSKFNRYTFDSSGDGYELELIANPTRDLRIFLNYSDGLVERTNIGMEARSYFEKYKDYWTQGDRGRILIDESGGMAPVADDGDNVVETIAEQVASVENNIEALYVLPEGEQARGQIRRQANLVANYTFHEGFLDNFSAGAGVRYRDGDVTAYNVSVDPNTGNATTSVLHGRSSTLLNLNFGYRGRFSFRQNDVRWSVQLNVNNVLDEDEILPTRVVNGVVTSYRLQIPREFILTTRFDF